MQDLPADQFSAVPVLLKSATQLRWSPVSWRLLGIQPGLSAAGLAEAARHGELLALPAMPLRLFRQYCESYHVNLTSSQPQVYLVCQQSPSAEEPKPLLLTVDFDEAASYMEAGQQVLEAPLPAELCIWLERFLMAHYQPKAPKKRRRQAWADDAGPESH